MWLRLHLSHRQREPLLPLTRDYLYLGKNGIPPRFEPLRRHDFPSAAYPAVPGPDTRAMNWYHYQ